MDKITFSTAKTMFMTYCVNENFSVSTRKAYQSDIEIFHDFIKNQLKNRIRYVDDIRPIEIELYKSHLLKTYKRSTARRKFNTLKSLYNTMHKFFNVSNLTINDSFGNTPNRHSDKEKLMYIRKQILTHDEMRRILKVIDESYNSDKYLVKALFSLLWHTGGRRSDILALDWDQIDFINDTIFLTRDKNNSANLLPLNSELKTALLDYWKCSCDKSKPWVMQSATRNRLSPTSFNNIIKKYVTLSKIDVGKDRTTTAHSFRHTLVTQLMKANVPNYKIRKYTGHRDDEALLIYEHLFSFDLEDVSDKTLIY